MEKNTKNEKIGALWKKSNARGEFLSGEIEINGTKPRVVVFPNAKTHPETGQVNENYPDYSILLARENPNQGAGQTAAYSKPQAPTSAPAKQAQRRTL